MLPEDYQQRVSGFYALMASMMRQRGFQRFIVGDETGVRMEDLPNVTMEQRGVDSVRLRTSGKEKNHVHSLALVTDRASRRGLGVSLCICNILIIRWQQKASL
jgi:hypothetical protein